MLFISDLNKLVFDNANAQSIEMKEWLGRVIHDHPVLFKAFKENRAGILLADISGSRAPRWAEINADLEIYGASVPKLGILLGILYNSVYGSDSQRAVLQNFSDEITAMIKKSNNLESGKLYALTSLKSIKAALIESNLFQWDERAQEGAGGMWCGAVYNTRETKEWFEQNPEVLKKYQVDFSEEKSPKSGELFALTARAGASFLLQMQRGNLINSNCSQLAKGFLEKISTSKFLKGILQSDNQVNWFGKTGTFNGNLSEVTLIEGNGYSYILSFLISSHRDNEVFEYLGEKVNSYLRNK